MIKANILALALLGLSLCGCEHDNTKIPVPNNKKLARVIIPLPVSHSDRSVGLEDAQYFTNYYEAIFVNSSGQAVCGSAYAEDGALELALPEDSYDIVLAAGWRLISPATPLLLASGYVTQQSIVAGEVNTITVTLRPLDLNIIVPESVVQGQSFEASVTVNTKNPFLDLTNYAMPLSSDLEDYTGTFAGLSANVYTWNYTVSTPQLGSGEFLLYVSQKQKYRLLGITGLDWYLAYYSTSASNTSFKAIREAYTAIIEVLPDEDLPDVQLIIIWGD